MDDGSTDGSREILRRYEGMVTVILKENGGQASAFNAGFEASRGDIIIFLDADDMLLPDTGARVAELFAQRPEIVKAHYPLSVIDPCGHATGDYLPPRRHDLPDGDIRGRLLTAPDDIPQPPTSGNAFSATALRRLLPMPERPYTRLADVYLLNLDSSARPCGSSRRRGRPLPRSRAQHPLHGDPRSRPNSDDHPRNGRDARTSSGARHYPGTGGGGRTDALLGHRSGPEAPLAAAGPPLASDSGRSQGRAGEERYRCGSQASGCDACDACPLRQLVPCDCPGAAPRRSSIRRADAVGLANGRLASGTVGVMSRASIAAVVVNHNTRDHLRGCLNALLSDAPAEVVVVDSGSSDGSADLVSREFPGVELVRTENRGYGAGANRGLERTRLQFALVLNADTRPARGTLDAMAEYLEDHPRAAIAGPLIVDEDGRAQVSAGRMPTPGVVLLQETGLHRLVLRRLKQPRAGEVDWTLGRCARDSPCSDPRCRRIR